MKHISEIIEMVNANQFNPKTYKAKKLRRELASKKLLPTNQN